MHPLLATAVRCARIAGNVILKHLDQVERIEIESKGRFDYVSDVDRMAEEQIRMHLDRAYPDHGIVAEESEARGEDREYVWIIDPLDGTTNFLHGYPMFAVSIAVARRGVLEHAAIYQPLANELFTASRGQGAQLNNRRIRCTSTRQLDYALLGRCSGVRRSGSAAMDLAHVAAGRLDGYWEMGLARWDVAAGALLVREAGGLVADIDGGQGFLDSGNIIAAGPNLFNTFFNLIRSRGG